MSKPDCATHSGSLCSPVWRLTHQSWLARAVDTVTAHTVRIVVIIVVALVVRAVLHRLIRRLTRTTVEATVPVALRPLKERTVELLENGNGGGNGRLLSERRRQRAETVGSIMRSIASFLTFTVAFILVLGELGIDLAPIIASAGIAGVAFGFGAQNLVRDFLAGMFMILEDQFGVGDVVDAGQATGTVEAVGLRTTRLRDAQGTVWYVRNGEVVRIGNKSQGTSRIILDVTVPATVDLGWATALLEEITAGLWADEEWRSSIIEEPTVVGVQDLTADGAVLRVLIRTRTGAEDELGRELRARLAARFTAEGLPAPVAVTPA